MHTIHNFVSQLPHLRSRVASGMRACACAWYVYMRCAMRDVLYVDIDMRMDNMDVGPRCGSLSLAPYTTPPISLTDRSVLGGL